MSTTWKEFTDEHNPDYVLRVESGCMGLKVEVENIATKKLMKFFLKLEDVEEFKLALDRAKDHT